MVTHNQGLLPRFSRHIHIADGKLVQKEGVL
jgi:ABC-type lipoprotein export system ATPase subunit